MAELFLCSVQHLGRNSFAWDPGPPGSTMGKSLSKYSLLWNSGNKSALSGGSLPELNEIRLESHLQQSWHRVSPQQITVIKRSLTGFLTRQISCQDASEGIFLQPHLAKRRPCNWCSKGKDGFRRPWAFPSDVGVGSGFANNQPLGVLGQLITNHMDLSFTDKNQGWFYFRSQQLLFKWCLIGAEMETTGKRRAALAFTEWGFHRVGRQRPAGQDLPSSTSSPHTYVKNGAPRLVLCSQTACLDLWHPTLSHGRQWKMLADISSTGF